MERWCSSRNEGDHIEKSSTKKDHLANFDGRTWGDDVVRGADISKRVLEVGIPKGASETVVKQIKEAVKYATDKGIEMNVRIVN